MLKNFIKNSTGLVLVEIMVAVAVIATAFIGFLTLEMIMIKARRDAVNRIKATYLAEEAIEAVRRVRDREDKGWTSIKNDFGTGDNDQYYPDLSSGDWDLASGAEDLQDADGRNFKRYIQFRKVWRCTNSGITTNIGDVCCVGDDFSNCQSTCSGECSSSEDVNSRKVSATVTWENNEKSVKMETFITNWKAYVSGGI